MSEEIEKVHQVQWQILRTKLDDKWKDVGPVGMTEGMFLERNFMSLHDAYLALKQENENLRAWAARFGEHLQEQVNDGEHGNGKDLLSELEAIMPKEKNE